MLNGKSVCGFVFRRLANAVQKATQPVESQSTVCFRPTYLALIANCLLLSHEKIDFNGTQVLFSK
jgi:hypothetical protein